MTVNGNAAASEQAGNLLFLAGLAGARDAVEMERVGAGLLNECA